VEMEVLFRQDKQVEARFEGFSVLTDQPKSEGGMGAAPWPFALFLASLATCAAFYAQGFCQARDIDQTGMKFFMRTFSDAAGRRLERVEMELKLPQGFPEKYEKAILRVANQCAVKKVMQDPPEFELKATR
jgi:putative redox protein